MERFMQENFVYAFAGVIILWIIIFIVYKIITKKKIEKLKGQDLIEIQFDDFLICAGTTLTDLQAQGYKVYAVNGEKPVIAGKSLMVPAGISTLTLEYFNTDYITKKRSTTVSYGKTDVEITLKPGICYTMKFDRKNNGFVLGER